MKFLRWIGFLILIIVVVFASYVVYFIFFHKEIPKTQANVNDKSLYEFSKKTSKLVNVWGDEMNVEEGHIVLPENREFDNSNRILISFIRIPSSHPDPKSPVFFLSGGPGTAASSIAKRSFFYVFRKLSQHADVVLIDQRGTGNSIPNLRCRNSMEMPVETAEDWEKDILEDIIQKCDECAEEFQSLGIDLGGYNSLESARDIEEVRKALQIPRITLLGYSYGTELAQHYVSMYEDKVDKLIFAGTTAPDFGVKLPAQMEIQYEVMDSLIKRDPKMSKYIPNFTQLMTQQHEELRNEPLKIKLPLMDAVSEDDGWFFNSIFKVITLFKPYWELTLSHTHMRMMMAQNSGRSAWTRIAPRYYYQLSQSEHNRLGNYLRNFRRQNMPNALFFTVTASTSHSKERWNLASASREKEMISHFDISFGRYPEVLEVFGISEINGLNRPVESEKELLLISGTLDGRTPISYADSISRRFPNSRTITIHNASHDDLIDVEILTYVEAFINDQGSGNIVLKRPFDFLPPVSYKYDILDTLELIRKTDGIDNALDRFRDIRLDYIDQDDYYYDIYESVLNNYGYELMGEGLIDDAVTVFRANADLFPNSYNVFNSLAEGLVAQGKEREATIHLKKAIELNYLDGHSHGLLRNLEKDD